MCTTGNKLRIFSDCDPVQKAKVLPLHCSGSTTSSDPIHGDPSNWKVSRRYLSLQHSASSPGFQVQPPVLTLLWQSKPNRSTRRLQAPRFQHQGLDLLQPKSEGWFTKAALLHNTQSSVLAPSPGTGHQTTTSRGIFPETCHHSHEAFKYSWDGCVHRVSRLKMLRSHKNSCTRTPSSKHT